MKIEKTKSSTSKYGRDTRRYNSNTDILTMVNANEMKTLQRQEFFFWNQKYLK